MSAMSVDPDSFQVSQSCGRQTAATRAAFSGSCRASQRSLVNVKLATGTMPTASAQARRAFSGPAEILDQLGGGPGAAGVVPQQRGADHLAVFVQHHHAVL